MFKEKENKQTVLILIIHFGENLSYLKSLKDE